LTKSFVFVLGLRKYAGLYSLPPGLGLLRALLPELLVVVLLLLDREVAAATGADRRSAQASQQAAEVLQRREVAGATEEDKMMRGEAEKLQRGGEGGDGGTPDTYGESGRDCRLRHQSAAGDDDEANASEVETGARRMKHGPGTSGAVLRETAASVARSMDLFPVPRTTSRWGGRSSRDFTSSGKRQAFSISNSDGGGGSMAGGESGGASSNDSGAGAANHISVACRCCGSGVRNWMRPVHGLLNFVDRLLIVDFGKSGAALYLASFGVSVIIMGWSLFHFSRLSASSSSYSTRCFDPVSGARQSLSASQFDAATVVSVLVAFGVIITDRAIYRIWRPPYATPSGISSDAPPSGHATRQAAGGNGDADRLVGSPGSLGSESPPLAQLSYETAPRHRSVALGLKLCLHIVLVCALHAHAFFGPLPAWHCESECASSRMTCERSGTLQFFYMLCCLYLLISARQVRMACPTPDPATRPLCQRRMASSADHFLVRSTSAWNASSC
jgi:hypothetical protein